MFRLFTAIPDSKISPFGARDKHECSKKSKIDYRTLLFQSNDFTVIVATDGIILDSSDESRFEKTKIIWDSFELSQAEILRTALLEFPAHTMTDNRLRLTLKAIGASPNIYNTGKYFKI